MPLIVLDPTSESVPSTARMAPALRSLAGATVGLPGYPFAVIPHPISSDGDSELRAKAEEAVHQCVQILTRR